MCLGIPGRIISIDGELGQANINGVTIRVGLQLIEDPRIGDYVLIHTGYALEKLSEEEALSTLETIRLLDKLDPDSPSLLR
jgi:hydrogenase expression/formation protein HypC